jgi:pimeloyl-ACP methyl ester carboxylesterase
MGIQEGFVEGDGVALHYLDWGGDGSPLVLIHATGFLARLWQPIADELSGRFRVVAVDQRGHGDSDKPQDGYRFEAFADDLQRLFEALDLESPAVAGHSSGGTTIVAHAARYPDVVQRAVLIEPILPRREWYTNPPGGRSPNSMADSARKRRAVWPSRAELLAAYKKRPAFETWRDDVLRLYVDEGTWLREDGQVELKCPPEIEAQYFDAVQHIEPWEIVSQLRCPTLVLWGGESNLHVHGLDAALQEALPGSRTVLVDHTTHFLPQERPDEVARLMLDFLSS